MVTAKEVKKIAEQSRFQSKEKPIEQVFKQIEKAILKAANRGDLYVEIPFENHCLDYDEIVPELEKLGYDINWIRGDITIYWDEDSI